MCDAEIVMQEMDTEKYLELDDDAKMAARVNALQQAVAGQERHSVFAVKVRKTRLYKILERVRFMQMKRREQEKVQLGSVSGVSWCPTNSRVNPGLHPEILTIEFDEVSLAPVRLPLGSNLTTHGNHVIIQAGRYEDRPASEKHKARIRQKRLRAHSRSAEENS